MKINILKTTGAAIINATILALVITLTFGGSLTFAQVAVMDPSFEVFRIRCQIDQDTDPATGLLVPKVQIQAKARADLLDGQAVGFMVENISAINPPLPSIVNSVFELGSAVADWDTFPDPVSLTPIATIPGDFVAADESIKITAQVTSTGQTATGVAQCADKTSSQFRQDTKDVCTLKKFNRGKCKSGDILPDGTIMP